METFHIYAGMCVCVCVQSEKERLAMVHKPERKGALTIENREYCFI